MNYRDKFLVQIMVCLAIFVGLRGVAMIDDEGFSEIKSTLNRYISKNYSLEEIKENGAELLDKITSAPAVLAGAVLQANEINEFGAPIDEKDTEGVQAVHAVAGGVVTYSGIDKEFGLCIKIQHEDKLSTYGHLDNISVITGERVKKGNIIGTFVKDNGEEFYYKLSDSMV
jgi:hypothetical protein